VISRKKNETLPVPERFKVDSKEDPAAAILQQLKRAFRWDKEACLIIGEAPEALRQKKLEKVERFCWMEAEMAEVRKTGKKKRRRPPFRMPRTTMRQRLEEKNRRIKEWSRQEGQKRT
jgi:hypothetical protein